MTVPFKYQKQCVKFIERHGGVALIADDMGLGKSLEVLLWAKNFLDKRDRIVVVCQASLKENWRREAMTHIGERADILEGTRPPRRRPRARIVIVNYDILFARRTNGHKKATGWLPVLQSLKPKLVIIDECQNVGNPAAKRTKALKVLCQNVPHRLALSGSAGMSNRPFELFATLNMLWPKRFPSMMRFGKRYCGARRRFGRWEFRGTTRTRELRRKLLRYGMIRRRKQDVLSELPEKQRIVVPFKLSTKEREEYDKACGDFVKWYKPHEGQRLSFTEKAEQMQKLAALRTLVGRLKLKYVIEWAETFLDTNHKLLLFGHHRAVLQELVDHFGRRAVLVNGKVTGKKRQLAFDSFNFNKKVRVCVGNTRAAGAGWSCKSTSTTATIEMDWAPGPHLQADARVHGVGRGLPTENAVNYYLVAADTIDEYLCKKVQQKQKDMSAIIDGKKHRGSLDVYDEFSKQLLRSYA